jgi:hypothetical protein
MLKYIFSFLVVVNFAYAVEIQTVKQITYTEKGLGLKNALPLANGNILVASYDNATSMAHLIVFSEAGEILSTQNFAGYIAEPILETSGGLLVSVHTDIHDSSTSQVVFLNANLEVVSSQAVPGRFNSAFTYKNDKIYIGFDSLNSDGAVMVFHATGRISQVIAPAVKSGVHERLEFLENGNLFFISNTRVENSVMMEKGYINIADASGNILSSLELEANVDMVSDLTGILAVQTAKGKVYMVSKADGNLLRTHQMDVARSLCALYATDEKDVYIQTCYDAQVHLYNANYLRLAAFVATEDLIANRPMNLGGGSRS